MNTIDGQFEVIKIDQLVEVENFKNFYQVQSQESEDQLKSSLRSNGQLASIVVTSDYTLVDGYRRLSLLSELGCEEVKVQVVEFLPSKIVLKRVIKLRG